MVIYKCEAVVSRDNVACAAELAKNGIDFVPIPVFGNLTKMKLVRLLMRQIAEMEAVDDCGNANTEPTPNS